MIDSCTCRPCSLATLSRRTEEAHRSTFDALDLNKDGLLTVDDLSRLMQLDTDENGEVSFGISKVESSS